MKCISALHGILVWIIVCLAVWMFVPTNMTFVHQNAGWVLGLALTGWWLVGKVRTCDSMV